MSSQCHKRMSPRRCIPWVGKATAILWVGTILGNCLQTVWAAPASEATSHFGPAPQLTGTPQQCNAAIRTWLMGGVSNVVSDLRRLSDERGLSDDSVRSFRQRLRAAENLGTPVEAALTNTQDRLKALEELIRNPNMDAATRQQSEENLQHTKLQLKALSLNKEKVATVRQKLADLGKTCEYWDLFWRTTAPAIGTEDTRKQMKGLIQKEQAKFLEWVGSEKGLNE